MSAHCTPDIAKQALGIGAYRVVNKQIDMVDIPALVRDAACSVSSKRLAIRTPLEHAESVMQTARSFRGRNACSRRLPTRSPAADSACPGRSPGISADPTPSLAPVQVSGPSDSSADDVRSHRPHDARLTALNA